MINDLLIYRWEWVVWGLFLIGGHWPKILPQNSKGGQLNVCTVHCVCVLRTFPPFGWNLCQVGRQFLSVVDNSKVLGIWYWFAWMSDISQLASWGWGVLRSPDHYTTWLRERVPYQNTHDKYQYTTKLAIWRTGSLLQIIDRCKIKLYIPLSQ